MLLRDAAERLRPRSRNRIVTRGRKWPQTAEGTVAAPSSRTATISLIVRLNELRTNFSADRNVIVAKLHRDPGGATIGCILYSDDHAGTTDLHQPLDDGKDELKGGVRSKVGNEV